jgi:ETC complex I subunit conserved region
MSAKIYSPAKTAMQSGKAKTGNWILEFDPAAARKVEPLMGYTSSSDMLSQVRLKFDTKEPMPPSMASRRASKSRKSPSAAASPIRTISSLTAASPGRTKRFNPVP